MRAVARHGRAPDGPGRWLWTYALITTSESGDLGHIHEGVPLLLPVDFIDTWRDPTLEDTEVVVELVGSAPERRVDGLLRAGIAVVSPATPADAGILGRKACESHPRSPP